MRNFKIATLLLAVLLIMAGVVSADQQNKKTIFTFKDSVQVPGSTLPAGTYVFKLASSDSNRHIVQIYNQDETKLITTILAVPNSQLTPSGETIITYAKAPANQPLALEAWFYPGDNFGQQFVYPEGVASELSTLNTMKVPSTGSEQAYPNSSSDTAATSGSTASGAATTTTTTTTAPSNSTDTMNSNASTTPSSSASSSTTSPSANSSNPSSPDNMSSPNSTATNSTNLSATKRSDDMKPRSDDTTVATTTTPSSTATPQTDAQATPDNMNRSNTSTSTSTSGTSAYSSQNPNSSSQATSDTSAQTQSDRSQSLPQTASPLPLAGLLGLLSISAAVVLRKLSL